jgi:hypothetical protein
MDLSGLAFGAMAMVGPVRSAVVNQIQVEFRQNRPCRAGRSALPRRTVRPWGESDARTRGAYHPHPVHRRSRYRNQCGVRLHGFQLSKIRIAAVSRRLRHGQTVAEGAVGDGYTDADLMSSSACGTYLPTDRSSSEPTPIWKRSVPKWTEEEQSLLMPDDMNVPELRWRFKLSRSLRMRSR